jgi:CHAT domain-containing protein
LSSSAILVFAGLQALYCFAQTPALEDRRNIVPATPVLREQQKTEEQAEALLRDFETATKVAALGGLHYQADDNKRTWGDYCRNARTLTDRGEFRLAVREASKALYLGQGESNSTARAYASRDLAYGYNMAGDVDRALYWANQSLTITDGGVGRTVSRGNDLYAPAYKVRGDAYFRKGLFDQAIKDYELARSNLDFSSRDKVYVTLSLANAQLAKGNYPEAKKLFEQYEDSGEVRAKILALRGLGELALKQAQAETAARHFGAASQLAEKKNLDYLAIFARDGLARAKLAGADQDGALAELRAATEAAERLRSRFQSVEIRAGFFGDIQTTFDNAIQLLVKRGLFDEALLLSERSRSRTLGDLLRDRASAAGRSVFVAPFSLEELRKQLPGGTAVIVYHVLDNEIVAWAIRQGSSRGMLIPVSKRETTSLVTAMRDAIVKQSGDALPIAVRLYDLLVKPLELKEQETVVFVPHKMLHYLPFSALRAPKGWLVEERPIATAVSLDTISAAMERPLQSMAAPVLALGNPDLGIAALALPGAEVEVNQIATLYPDAAVYVRRDATRDRFLKQAVASQLVHVAAHASIDEIDPMYSYIKLAQGAGNSGDVEAHEIYKLNLSGARIVTLSTCNSGIGRVSLGDEFWGFKRSFIAAGARSLLLSLWPIIDESTPQLMKVFYDKLRTHSSAEALRLSQLELIKGGKYSDPVYWAPFLLVGDWR